MIKVSRKGSSNERSQAKVWSLWFSHGARDDLIWRVRGSGGRATIRRKKNLSTSASYGDLTFTDPIAEPLFRMCTIELKKGYKNLDILSTLDGKGKKYELNTFLKQAIKEAESASLDGWGANPILIVHKDRRLPIIVMTLQFFNQIVEFCGTYEGGKILFDCEDINWVSITLSGFFDWCNPDFFNWKFNQRKVENE